MPLRGALRLATPRMRLVRRCAVDWLRSTRAGALGGNTLTGAGILRHMAAAQRAGFWIVLHFVSVGLSEQALDRIRNRVALGGHNVPEADARWRFVRSHANLPVG